MPDHIDELLTTQNREAVNIAMVDDAQRWAEANQPCTHPRGHHWQGDAGWWVA